MTRAAMSTIEHGLRHEIEDDMADAQFTGFYAAAAIREASMLVERNEPGATRERDTYYTPLGLLRYFDSGSILAEAIARFVAE